MIRIKILVTSFLIFISFNITFCQKSKFLDCNYIKKSLEMEIFEKHFFMGRYKNETIVIIDTIKMFQDCNIQEINDRKFKLENFLSDTNNKKIIALDKIEKKGNKNILHFLFPSEKCTIVIEIWEHKRKIKTKLLRYGVF